MDNREKMVQGKIAFGILILELSYTSLAVAQTHDRFGDYSSNEAPKKGTVSNSPLIPGSLWRVIVNGLNCRSAPGTENPIVHQFTQGQVIQVEVGRGGSDEVLQNVRDRTGKPWMWVRGGIHYSSETPSLQCYVRANTRYIQPDLGSISR